MQDVFKENAFRMGGIFYVEVIGIKSRSESTLADFTRQWIFGNWKDYLLVMQKIWIVVYLVSVWACDSANKSSQVLYMTKFKNFGGVWLSTEGSNTINRKQMIHLKLTEPKLIARNRD